jgi:hypothetical protein
MKGQFDNNITASEIIGRKFCLRPEAVRRWMKKKGYTSKHFKKMIEETRNLERFFLEVLNA